MNCWICGEDGDSGEHTIKSSDLKEYFGEVTEENPIFWFSKEYSNKLVKSLKSKPLKSPARICQTCNNTRTQSHDRSWEKLSKYLLRNIHLIKDSSPISLRDIYNDEDINLAVTGVQLFFVKQFGCRVIEGDIPINLDSFSKAILKSSFHEHIYLAFGKLNHEEKFPSVAVTDVRTQIIGETILLAQWNYIVGQLVVRVVYDPLKRYKKLLRNCWHPKNHGYKIKIYQGKA